MIDAAGTPTRVGAGDLSFYKDVAEVDQHPGFMNGVLSLILSGNDPDAGIRNSRESRRRVFQSRVRLSHIYFLQAGVRQSKYLAEMYLGVVNVFSPLGRAQLAIEAGREFQQLFPDSPSYVDVLIAHGRLLCRFERPHERARLLLPSCSIAWLARSQKACHSLPHHQSAGLIPSRRASMR